MYIVLSTAVRVLNVHCIVTAGRVLNVLFTEIGRMGRCFHHSILGKTASTGHVCRVSVEVSGTVGGSVCHIWEVAVNTYTDTDHISHHPQPHTNHTHKPHPHM